MNVILEDKAHKCMLDIVNFNTNEHSIINRNMPFMFQKVTRDDSSGEGNLKQHSFKHSLTKKENYFNELAQLLLLQD